MAGSPLLSPWPLTMMTPRLRLVWAVNCHLHLCRHRQDQVAPNRPLLCPWLQSRKVPGELWTWEERLSCPNAKGVQGRYCAVQGGRTWQKVVVGFSGPPTSARPSVPQVKGAAALDFESSSFARTIRRTHASKEAGISFSSYRWEYSCLGRAIATLAAHSKGLRLLCNRARASWTVLRLPEGPHQSSAALLQLTDVCRSCEHCTQPLAL